MSDAAIRGEYELNTGVAIVKTFKKKDPMAIPAVLVANHGPFAWGTNAAKASENAWMLEAAARMAYFTRGINADAQPIGRELHDKHYLRKHGATAYYGQPKGSK